MADGSDTITVNYPTSDGSATAGTAYTSAAGTLTFNPGDTNATIDVWVTDEDVNDSKTGYALEARPAGITNGQSPMDNNRFQNQAIIDAAVTNRIINTNVDTGFDIKRR